MSNSMLANKDVSILVVDDVPDNLRILVSLLTEQGYRVRPASEGNFALESARKDPPDLILLDILMPEIDGYEVCRRFKKDSRTQDIPIIFVTAKNTTASQTRGFDLGAVDYITKPIDPDVVIARVKTQLELKQHRNHLEDLVKERTRELSDEIEVRREAEKHLRCSEARLASIIDTFQGFIYSTSSADSYLIDYMNGFLIDHLGFDGTGKRCYEVIFNRTTPCSECDLTQLKDDGFLETELRHPLSGRWFNVMHRLQHPTTGNKARRQTILIDITRQKLAEIELKEKEEALRRENLRLKASIKERFRFGCLIGRSKPMQEVYETIVLAASENSFVSIYGESGTGKELVAREIHQHSERSGCKLVSVNCGAIPENLAESEFFGYKKGAFTGANKDKIGFLEEADGGTLFLDEIGEIGLGLQIKLLRVLDGYGFSPLGSRNLVKPDVRIITATNQDLKRLVKEGKMRQDFFYRIHVIPINLPPLRERKEDIPLLVEGMLDKYNKKQSFQLSAKIMEGLQAYDWPGNVRELQNTLYRYLTLGKLDLINLSEPHSAPGISISDLTEGTEPNKLPDVLLKVERKLITDALNQNQWRRERTAKTLGITPKTLYRRMKQFQIIK